MTDNQEFSLFTKEVPRGKRGEVFGIDVPHRAEQLNQAVAAILHSLAVSTPELTYVQAQGERQTQVVSSPTNTPAIDPRLTAANVRGTDGASSAGNYVQPAYVAPVTEARSSEAAMTERPVGPAAQPDAEAMRSMTGISATEERAMEANAVAAAQPTEVAPRPAAQGSNPDLEAEARFLIDQVFGTEGESA